MDFYVSQIRILRNYDDNSKFAQGNSIIIRFKDKDDGKVHVRRGVILKIGNEYLYVQTSKEHWNHKRSYCWCCFVKTKIKDIQVMKHFKNVLDEVK
jgi:hypothetical protein